MYGGKIVEIGTVDEIFYNPQHPYTWGLISSMPTLDTDDEELFVIPGTPPDLLHPPKGTHLLHVINTQCKLTLKKSHHYLRCLIHYAATWLLHPDAPEVTPPDAVLRRQEQFAELHPGMQAVHAKG